MQGAVVLATRRLQGCLWRHAGCYRDDAFHVDFGTMTAVLRAGLQVRYLRFGNAVLEQLEGLPVGGALSDVGANILLTVQEATWRSDLPWRLLEGFEVMRTAADVQAMAACMRYVDDVVAMSTHLCLRCLEEMVVRSHPGVPFSVECSTAGAPGVAWLAVVIYPCRLPPHVSMAEPESAWVRLLANDPVKFRIPPYLGEQHLRGDTLRLHVRSRLVRWAHVQLARPELRRALHHDIMMLMARSGYPWQRELTEWQRHAADLRARGLPPALGCYHAGQPRGAASAVSRRSRARGATNRIKKHMCLPLSGRGCIGIQRHPYLGLHFSGVPTVPFA